jgi:LmbE family N-acetylglucosaminyl deacetylase/SAM-dependent methyltransferase
VVSFDASAIGTTVLTWHDDPRWATAPMMSLDRIESLIVVAAHPDDETLGAGGIIHACARRGIPVEVVIVTDGAASHPGDALMPFRRAREAHKALSALAPSAQLTLLGFADAETHTLRREIRLALADVIATASPRSTVLAPWRGDGHRDHRVVGEIVASLVAPDAFLEYPVWMWHWGHPDHPAIDWSRMRAVAIDPAAKQRAIAAYTSQTSGAQPVVSAAVLDAAANDREFVIGDARAFTATPVAAVADTTVLDSRVLDTARVDPVATYLDRAYARRDDPWRVETRWYEQRKRAMTLAALPARRYTRALEVGCSIGVLTADLADRCDDLLAIDVSAVAVERARARLDDHPAVRVEQVDLRTELPPGPFDLVVLSEVGYYLTREQLDAALAELESALGDRGTLLACHWRRSVAEHLLTGDEVHAVIARRGLPLIVRHEEADFVLDVYSRDACSVAQHEGIT